MECMLCKVKNGGELVKINNNAEWYYNCVKWSCKNYLLPNQAKCLYTIFGRNLSTRAKKFTQYIPPLGCSMRSHEDFYEFYEWACTLEFIYILHHTIWTFPHFRGEKKEFTLLYASQWTNELHNVWLKSFNLWET